MGVIMIVKTAPITVTNMKTTVLWCAAVLALTAIPASAWDGYDYETGSFVEIEKGNLVRQGRDIEFYDWEAGEHRTAEVQSIRRFGNSVEVEVMDYETGELRTFDMDD